MIRKQPFGWPLQVLKALPRLVHGHSTYLWDGHTIAWGEPFATDELQLCLNDGADPLCDRLEAAGTTDVVDPQRASVAPA
jgi:hypothetical protein